MALEPKIRIASQSVFYAMCIRDGTCATGCGVSQTHIAEIVFGIEIVEWDLCSACLSLTGFLEYASGWKPVLGMKGALTAIRMALTALCWIRKLPGWVL